MDILYSLFKLIVILLALFGIVMIGYFINRKIEAKRRAKLNQVKSSKLNK